MYRCNRNRVPTLSSLQVVCWESRMLRKYSGPSRCDRLDIRTTLITTKILVLTYDQILSYDLHGVRKL
jgi:hypothetical protein